MLDNEYTPTQDYVLIARHKEDEVSHGGILLVKEDRKQPAKGDIIAVGPDVHDVVLGNTVLWVKGSEKEIILESKSFSLIAEKDILGTWEK